MNPQDPNQAPQAPDQQSPVFQPAPPPNQYDPRARVDNSLSVTQPGEVTICEIKRHPIGIIAIYVAIGVMLLIAAVLAFVVAPNFVDTAGVSGSQSNKVGSAIFLTLTVVAMIYALIVTKIYWGNRWVVTSDSVTQVSQTGLFSRQSAQLALINIEDVTAEQNGLIAQLFHYGVLKAETAGHRSKFVFNYCPNPNYYAQQILAAREALGPVSHHGGHAGYTTPQPPQPQAGYPQQPPAENQSPTDPNQPYS